MTEAAIRALVIASVVDCKVVEEVVVGKCRVDVAAFDGRELHGYEIKSDKDTVKRLPAQLEAYSKVFGTVTVICGPKHCLKVLELVPPWTCVLVAEASEMTCVQMPGINPLRDPIALGWLLWRTELLAVLRKWALPLIGRKPALVKRLADELPIAELVAAVSTALRDRPTWARLAPGMRTRARVRRIRRRRRRLA